MSSQSDIKTAGILGLVGTVLMLIPYYVNIVGYILVLVALYMLSKAYGNDAIWRNALYALIAAIVGSALLIFSAFAMLGATAFLTSLSYTLSSIGVIGYFIALFIIAYVIIIISGRFMRNAYNELGGSSNIEYFNRAARWYWLGAVLTIVIVGVILYIIADIYAIIGYSKLIS